MTSADATLGAHARPFLQVASHAAPRRTHYLQPGQVLACIEPTTVTTILGSCVSVCLWDHCKGVGAMNHYVLPHRYVDHEQSLRCGPIAIARLVEEMRALGCARGDLRAKLFGGAWILAAPLRPDHVGALNVRVARDELGKAGIPIAAEDVGGDRGRKIVFHTESGIALVKKL
jgi:chemotaxis protein CheD